MEISMKLTAQTLFIIDDDVVVCNALRCLFESIHFKVETYHRAAIFLENRSYARQGCLIIDVRMPEMSGLELFEQLKLQKNHLPVIFITGYGDIPMAVRAMKAGATDFVLKPFNDQCLVETVQKCIKQSINTNSYISSIAYIDERFKRLSEREGQVLELIMRGNLNKEIAFELSVSISTVEVHRANIMQKMQAKNLTQLIKMYVQTKYSRMNIPNSLSEPS